MAVGTDPATPQSTEPRLYESDIELARQVQSGDQAACEQLVERYADALFNLAVGLLGNAADAEDLVQETLLVVFHRIRSFQGRSALKTWIYRILLNKASKVRRQRQRRKYQQLGGNGGPGAAEPDVRQASPARAVEAKTDVLAMLGTLSEDYRAVIVMRELQHLSYEEISQALTIPIGTVESRLYRARQELRRRYNGYLS